MKVKFELMQGEVLKTYENNTTFANIVNKTVETGGVYETKTLFHPYHTIRGILLVD